MLNTHIHTDRHFLSSSGSIGERAFKAKPRAERCTVRVRELGGMVVFLPLGWRRWPVAHRDAYFTAVDGPVGSEEAPAILASLCKAGFGLSFG